MTFSSLIAGYRRYFLYLICTRCDIETRYFWLTVYFVEIWGSTMTITYNKVTLDVNLFPIMSPRFKNDKDDGILLPIVLKRIFGSKLF